MRRRWTDGLGAALIVAIILLGVDAGLTRSCMPNLNWSIFLTQIELTVALLAPRSLVLLLPAFATAGLIGTKPARLGISLLTAYIVGCVVLALVASNDLRIGLGIGAALCISAAIGYVYVRFAWMRRLGVPMGLLIGAIAGVTIFLALPFGADDCYP
jgi:hypothetical protein